MSVPVMDVVVARKGSSGKTITALSHFDALLTAGRNVLLLDMNDMNPDSFKILDALFKFVARVLGEEAETAGGTPFGPGMILYEYDLGSFKAFREAGDIGRPPKYLVAFFRGNRPVRWSSYDIWSAIASTLETIAELGKEVDSIVMDTNTSHMGLNIAELKYWDFAFLQDIASELEGSGDVMSSLAESMWKRVRERRMRVVLSYVCPLSSLTSGGLEFEKEEVRRFQKAITAPEGVELIPNLIVNYYSPTGMPYALPSQAPRIPFLGWLLGRRRGATFTYSSIMSFGRRIAEKVGGKADSSPMLLDLDKLFAILEEFSVREVADVKKYYESLHRAIISMFLLQTAWAQEMGLRVANLTVIPLYDPDLTVVFEYFRALVEGGGLEEMLEQFNAEEIRALRRELVRQVMRRGLFRGVLRFFRRELYGSGQGERSVLEHFLDIVKSMCDDGCRKMLDGYFSPQGAGGNIETVLDFLAENGRLLLLEAL